MFRLASVSILVPALLACETASAGDVWPEALYSKLSAEVTAKAQQTGGNSEVWHGGSAFDSDSGGRVGLVFWGGPSDKGANKGLVASCFENTATTDPEIVVYLDDLSKKGFSEKLVDVSYSFDLGDENESKWALIEPYKGGLYIARNGDVYLRSMIAGATFSVKAVRLNGETRTDTFSLMGFTKEFTKVCDWHPRYQQWVSSSKSRKPQATNSIENELRIFARNEYPNDSRMQQFVYKKQLSAYRYLSSVKDSEAKAFARNEYSSDYSMQKFVYDKQVAAKRYMSRVASKEIKSISVMEYPHDYAMQQFVYDKQLAAKEYMSSADNLAAKARAVNKYPRDYAMQKFTYEQLAF